MKRDLSKQNNPNYKGGSLMIKCLFCDKEFEVSRKKYNHNNKKTGRFFCTREHADKWKAKNLIGKNSPIYKQVELPCVYCNKIFSRPPSQVADSNLCSKECFNSWYKGSNTWSWTGGDFEFTCSNCGILFKRNKKNIKNNKKFTFCSQECNKQKMIGKDSPFWKGGISPILMALRMSKEGKKWVSDVFKRDKSRCIKCNSNKRITAHHISSFSRFPELRFVVDNGATLCIPCHRKFHKIYGITKFTSDDFYQFLKNNV